MSNTRRAGLPRASVLFDRDELFWYIARWQEQCELEIVHVRDVPLPTAYKYAEYLEWMHKQRISCAGQEQASEHATRLLSSSPGETLPKSPSVTAATGNAVHAARCKHLLHPGHPAAAPSTAEQAGSNAKGKLNKIWSRWAALGGPWRKLPDGVKGEDYGAAKQTFQLRKVDLVNMVEELETIAQLEAAWEAANPETEIPEVVKQQGASKTVYMYHLGNAVPERSGEASVMAALQTPTSTSRKAGNKRLSYSPGTPEDTRHRPSDKYARGYPSYDPKSPHACPDEEGWADTALCQDWGFNVRQCRFLYCDKSPGEPDVTYQELSDDQSKDRLLAGIDIWLAKMKRTRVPRWIATLKDTSAIFLAWDCGADDKNKEEGFHSWEMIETLVGTKLEAHAQATGDIDDEDVAEHQRVLEERKCDEETREDSDEVSMQLSSDTEDSDEEMF
ncbi:hypothetical protein J1614_006107 [Plenodomus biglobosus]|nr:hypothetical protein J1614_006107 [Plenodomus biglobosus]